MPNADYSSPLAWRRSSRSRCTSRRADFWRRLWRGFCFAIGIWYAWAHLSAEFIMARVVFGGMRPSTELLADAERAVNRFPFDPYMRSLRRYTREQIERIPPRPDE